MLEKTVTGAWIEAMSKTVKGTAATLRVIAKNLETELQRHGVALDADNTALALRLRRIADELDEVLKPF